MKKIAYSVLVFGPALAFAASLTGLGTLLSQFKTEVLDRVLPILFGLAIIYFFWGLIKYIRNVGSDPKAAAEGRSIMIWGVVALAVMIAVYGLINFLVNTFGLTDTNINLPKLPNS